MLLLSVTISCAGRQEPERAAEVFEIARHGHSAHGRGCVYLRATLKSRFNSGGRGAKAARQRSTAQSSSGAMPHCVAPACVCSHLCLVC